MVSLCMVCGAPVVCEHFVGGLWGFLLNVVFFQLHVIGFVFSIAVFLNGNASWLVTQSKGQKCV
jgi:hypothetical protein